MNTKLPVIALVLLLFAAPILPDAAVLDVPGAYPTIQTGIDTAAEGDTVLVAPGTYYENLNLTGKSITLASHYITTGDTMYMHETVIDGNHKGAVVKINNKEVRTSPSIIGFTIQNGVKNFSDGYGGGIRCYYANPLIDHMIVRNNTYNGGINARYSNPVIKNVTLINNSVMGSGGGASFWYSNPYLSDVVVVNNSAWEGAGLFFIDCESAKCERMVVRGNDGEGICCSNSKVTMNKVEISNNKFENFYIGGSTVIITNSTLAGDVKYFGDKCIRMSKSHLTLVNSIIWRMGSPEQIVVMNEPNESSGSFIHIVSSDILNGISGIKGYYKDIDITADIYFSDANLSDYPLFIDPYNNDFTLQKNSPCIDKGLVHYELNGETIVSIPENEFIGSAPDIGAYEFIESNSVEKEEAVLPSLMFLSPYPNPFNASVTIPYRIQTCSNISLAVYNCTGQKIAELTNGFHAPGTYSVLWDASGFASGLYYCRLKSGNASCIEKILYLK